MIEELCGHDINKLIYKALYDRDMVKAYGEMIPNMKNNTSMNMYLEKENYNRAELILSYLMTTESNHDNHEEIIMKSF